MAGAIFTSEWGAKARVRDVLPPDSIGEFADKIASLDEARRGLIRVILESSSFGTFTARLLSRMVFDVAFHGRRNGPER